MKKFLLIGETTANLIQFIPFPDGTHSFVKYWFDLKDLDGKTVFR
jgi:hypothetical protein